MQAEERRGLLEAAAGGDSVVDVQLAIAALEVAAADARLTFGCWAGGVSFWHGDRLDCAAAAVRV